MTPRSKTTSRTSMRSSSRRATRPSPSSISSTPPSCWPRRRGWMSTSGSAQSRSTITSTCRMRPATSAATGCSASTTMTPSCSRVSIRSSRCARSKSCARCPPRRSSRSASRTWTICSRGCTQTRRCRSMNARCCSRRRGARAPSSKNTAAGSSTPCLRRGITSSSARTRSRSAPSRT